MQVWSWLSPRERDVTVTSTPTFNTTWLRYDWTSNWFMFKLEWKISKLKLYFLLLGELHNSSFLNYLNLPFNWSKYKNIPDQIWSQASWESPSLQWVCGLPGPPSNGTCPAIPQPCRSRVSQNSQNVGGPVSWAPVQQQHYCTTTDFLNIVSKWLMFWVRKPKGLCSLGVCVDMCFSLSTTFRRITRLWWHFPCILHYPECWQPDFTARMTMRFAKPISTRWNHAVSPVLWFMSVPQKQKSGVSWSYSSTL